MFEPNTFGGDGIDHTLRDNFYNEIIFVLGRSFDGRFIELGNSMVKSEWCLTGETLAFFMKNYSLLGCNKIYVSYSGSFETFLNIAVKRCYKKIDENTYSSPSGIIWNFKREDNISEVCQEFPKDYERTKFHFPVNLGEVCDKWNKDWTEVVPRINPYEYKNGCFFDEERRKNGHELIGKLLECGERAGIRDKMFLGFGGLLGYALAGDFLPNDDDIDLCIMECPQDQRHQYFLECKKAGLMENRERGPVSIEDKYVWFSLGPKSPYIEHGVKSCNWFFFNHGGYWFHSKGSQWTGRRGLDENYPTAKGIPERIFSGKFKTVKFGSVLVQVPENIGTVLDWWYPQWVCRKNESSKISAILVMPTNDRKTWFIEQK